MVSLGFSCSAERCWPRSTVLIPLYSRVLLVLPQVSNTRHRISECKVKSVFRLFCASAFTGRLGVNGRCCSPDMPECIRLDLVSRVSHAFNAKKTSYTSLPGAWFSSGKMAFGVRKTPIFPMRGRLTASADYHPHVHAQKVELHLSADPIEKNRVLGPEMVKIKIGISFKRLQFFFFHSYVSSIAPKDDLLTPHRYSTSLSFFTLGAGGPKGPRTPRNARQRRRLRPRWWQGRWRRRG